MTILQSGCILLQLAALAVPPLFAAAQPSPPAGYTISTFAGNNTSGFSGDGSAATSAQISGPYGIAIDSAGNLFFADQHNHRIRKVDNSGNISTVAGNGTSGFSGDGSGATSAELASPLGVAVDSSGNLYIADTGNNRIRKVTSGGTISTIAGLDTAGFSGDGAAATSAELSTPVGIAVDSSGNLYIADTGNNRIRKIGTDGNINTIAGDGTAGSAGDNGPAAYARLKAPRGVTLDGAGNLYIADADNNRIRKVTTDGTITTVAGSAASGFAGDGGPANAAVLNGPRSVAVDTAGNLYISDYYNSRVRKVAANGTIFTIAGNGLFAYYGDGGPATDAILNFPLGIAVGSGGKVYISDSANNVIRLLTPSASNAPPAIQDGGVVTASAFGAFNTVAPGSWIEIYGSNLAINTRTWTAKDFNGSTAPAVLDGTTVTIGGQAAAISYISPTQVNAQVPSTVGTGPQQITVTTASGTSAAYTITVNDAQPGLYAPPAFKVNGLQYAGATFPDGTFVGPVGALPGVTSHPAKPGDTIILYGVGFGPVNPSIPSGWIVDQANTLSMPFQVMFGEAPANLAYDGLAPNQVGLYQFNVVVPNVANNDAVSLKFSLGGVLGTQTLYIAVHD